MPERQGPDDENEVRQSGVEFDLSQYPDLVSGFALPITDEGIVEVEILDSLDEKQLVGVPSAAVSRLGMPRVRDDLPSAVKEPFEAGIGLALIACRVDERQDELVRISLPAVTGNPSMTVNVRRLPKKAG